MIKISIAGLKILVSIFTLSIVAPAVQAAGINLRTDKGAPVLVNADNYSGDSEAHIMELSGHVRVVYSGQAISCDHAIIRDVANEIEADGHLVIDSPNAHIEGQRASLNYKTNLGVIEKGFVVSGQIMLEGERILKIGPNEYIAENGNYTACTTCPPAWGFRAKRIDAELGGYARLKSVLFEVLNFPIIWLPYLIVPLKSDRQSGFLIPRVSIAPSTNDAKGLRIGLAESYFWAIDRSQDATFTLSSNPANGIKGLIDYRYLLNETSRGELGFGALQDKLFNGNLAKLYPTVDTSKGETYGPPLSGNFTRWFLRYEHHYDLPDDFTQNTKINLLSDFRYPIDNPEDFTNIAGERALESRFTLSKNSESTHSSLDASYYINLLKSDPLNGGNGTVIAGNSDAVHRAPELRYSIVNSKIGSTRFLFHADANFVHFARQDLSYDDLTVKNASCYQSQTANCSDSSRGKNRKTGVLIPGTAQFDPARDVLRTGDRLDIHPEISYPFQIGKYFDIVPAISYRHVQYNFDVSPDSPHQSPPISEDPTAIGYDTHPSRSYFIESISARTRLSSVWGTEPGNPREVRLKHELQPELRISTLAGMNETQSPFLSSNEHTPAFLADQPISDSDIFDQTNLRSLQFDYNDRIIRRNIITGILTNKLIRKTWSHSTPPPANPDLKTLNIETNTDQVNYLQIIGLKIWQSFDLDAATRTPHYPWSDIDALLDFHFQNIETNLLVKYFPDHNVANTSLRSRIFDKYENFLQLTYNENFKITENVGDANYNPSNHTQSVGIGAGIVRRYIKLSGNINLNPVDLSPIEYRNTYSINSWDAVVTITPPGNCWGVGFKFINVLGGNGTSAAINFDYQFGGGAPPIPSSSI